MTNTTARAERPARIWTRDFTLAALTNLLLSSIFMGFIVTMAPYAVEHLGANESVAGAVASTFVIGALISRPFAGRFLDVIGRRRIAIVGTAGQVVACGLYLLADTLPLLLSVRFLHGIAFGFVNTALAASVIAMLPPRRRSEGTGYFGMSGVLAGAMAPLVAVPLLANTGPVLLFGGAGGVALLAFGLALLLRLPSPIRPVVRTSGPVLRTMLEPAVLPVASIMLIAGAGMSAVLAYLSLYTTSIGLPGMTGLFFLVNSATVLLVRPFAGRLHDRRGDNTVIYPAIISLAIALALIGLARSPLILLLGAVFLAIGFGTLMSSMQAIAVTVAPRERVGLATSTFFLVLDIGTGLGPIVLGLAIANWGYSPMYLAAAGFTLVALLIYYLGHGRTDRRRVGPMAEDPPPAHPDQPAQDPDQDWPAIEDDQTPPAADDGTHPATDVQARSARTASPAQNCPARAAGDTTA